jgi:general stress protein CsbA
MKILTGIKTLGVAVLLLALFIASILLGYVITIVGTGALLLLLAYLVIKGEQAQEDQEPDR